MQDSYDGIHVICASFGRTGTTSMKAALEMLLGRPCYHMRDVIKLQHANFWIRAFDNDPKLDFDEVFASSKYAATCDFP